MTCVAKQAVLDLLDESLASDEVLQAWRADELRSMKAFAEASKVQELSPHLRSQMLWLQHIVSSVLNDDSMDDFALTVLRHDRTSKLLPLLPNSAAARCAAIASLVMKLRQSQPPGAVKACLANLKSLTEFKDSDLTMATVREEESKILKALGFRLHVPCLRSWLELFVRRLSVFSEGQLLGHLLQQVLAHNLRVADGLLWSLPCHSIQLHSLAAGLAALGLAEAGLVDWAALRPDHMGRDVWEAMRPRVQSPQGSQRVLEWLLRAIDMSLPEMQSTCGTVASGLRGLAQAQGPWGNVNSRAMSPM